MEKNKSAAKGFAILSAAGILNKVLSVIYIPVLLQILDGNLGYGIYSAGYSIYVFIYSLTNSGFPMGISKLQAEFIAHKNFRDARRSFKIIRLIMLSYGLFMAAFTAIFARQITNVLHYERSYYVILALSPTMLFSALSSSYRGYFNGNSDMKPTAVSQIVEQFLNVTLSLTFALLFKPYGIEMACAGATVGTTLGSLGSALYLKSKYKKTRSLLDKKTPEDVRPIRIKTIVLRLMSYSIPIAISSIIIFGGDIIDLWNTKQRLIAAGFSSNEAYIKYGILGKYTQLLSVPLAITAAMYVAMMPFLSSAIELKNNKMLKNYINQAFRTSLMIAIPAAFGMCILSKPIFLLLFSGKYADGWYLMVIGSIVIILVCIVQIQSGILQAFNKTKISNLSMLAGIFIKIFINYFLIAIPSINVTGAVIGTIICYIIAIYINSKYIKNSLPVNISIKKYIGRPFVSSAVMGASAALVYKLFSIFLSFLPGSYLPSALATIIAIFTSIIVYAIVMFKIGGLTKNDLDIIPYSKKLKKFIPSFIISLAKVK